MSGRIVVRGVQCATSSDHIRASERHFFPPSARWQFSGRSLAKDRSATIYSLHANDNCNKDKFLNDVILGLSSLPKHIPSKYLYNNGRNVVVIDSNQTNIEKAREMGLEAISTDIYTNTLNDNIELNDVG